MATPDPPPNMTTGSLDGPAAIATPAIAGGVYAEPTRAQEPFTNVQVSFEFEPAQP